MEIGIDLPTLNSLYVKNVSTELELFNEQQYVIFKIRGGNLFEKEPVVCSKYHVLTHCSRGTTFEVFKTTNGAEESCMDILLIIHAEYQSKTDPCSSLYYIIRLNLLRIAI